jgi:hypothetical protein
MSSAAESDVAIKGSTIVVAVVVPSVFVVVVIALIAAYASLHTYMYRKSNMMNNSLSRQAEPSSYLASHAAATLSHKSKKSA